MVYQRGNRSRQFPTGHVGIGAPYLAFSQVAQRKGLASQAYLRKMTERLEEFRPRTARLSTLARAPDAPDRAWNYQYPTGLNWYETRDDYTYSDYCGNRWKTWHPPE